jgi:hypothetical protein
VIELTEVIVDSLEALIDFVESRVHFRPEFPHIMSVEQDASEDRDKRNSDDYDVMHDGLVSFVRGPSDDPFVA